MLYVTDVRRPNECENRCASKQQTIVCYQPSLQKGRVCKSGVVYSLEKGGVSVDLNGRIKLSVSNNVVPEQCCAWAMCLSLDNVLYAHRNVPPQGIINMRSAYVILTLMLQSASGLSVLGDDREQATFFENKIRPILVSECYECHSASSKSVKGGLLIDTREGIRRGGESGHGVVPGEVGDSLIIDAMQHEGLDMPPEKKLSDQVIKDFERWIQMGAYDPRDGKSALIRSEIDMSQAREFWSFRPIADVLVPRVQDSGWVKSDIDRFVSARLASKTLTPVADADSKTLVRRIYFDLVGLPPTPVEVDRFSEAMQQDPDAAIAEVVDRLLDSDQFGERWGRHWLDVVRYAESTGMERNGTFTSAWRYRDYVIESFNRDTPYDAFIREQISGDLLDFQTNQQRDRQLIATGMLALGPKSLNESKKEKFLMDVVDEQIDVVSRSFLGVTASCARCHDHKFDPIPQSEYYALAGIFTSTRTMYGTSKTNGNRNPGQLLSINGNEVRPVAVSGGAAGSAEEKRYQAQLKKLNRKLASYEKQAKNTQSEAAKRAADKRVQNAKDDVRRVRNRLRQVTQPSSNPGQGSVLVMAVGEAGNAKNTRLRIRGEPSEYGPEIARGFLTIGSDAGTPGVNIDGSGRLELAEWIARPEHPLTARVAVNRIWQHLFGRGIVSTVNNFGVNGTRPTHPMLLDYLATRFVEDGWSVKSIIRRIMLSRVYRLSSQAQSDQLAGDPDNFLLWRMSQRRLEGEAIRDAMLAVSGQLIMEPRTGSPVQKLGEGLVGRNIKVDVLQKDDRLRSVYLPIVRGAVPEMLALFDFPEPSIVGGVRNVTTVPTQALFMMNSPVVLELSKHFANRLVSSETGGAERVKLAYRLALSRVPTSQETKRALEFVEDTQRTLQEVDKMDAKASEAVAWIGICQSLFASTEFRYIN